MSDGILCKKCGWQETEHELRDGLDPKLTRRRIEGYKRSLDWCVENGGYLPSEELPEEDPDTERFKLEAMEKRADGNAAFGLLGSLIRQQNFNEELAVLEDELRRSSGDSRIRAQKARDNFIENGVHANHMLHIGPF